MGKSKKEKQKLNEKINIVIGVLVGIITLAIIVIVGIAMFSALIPKEEQVGDVNTEVTPATEQTQNNTQTVEAQIPEQLQAERTNKILMQTSKGNVSMVVYPDLMPITVQNFVGLISQNFYNGLTFHRVENWIVQGGDPLGNGTGGSANTIKFEANEKLSNTRGALAMARSTELDSASSQFYIVKQDATNIDGQYAVFGRVTEGMGIVDSLTIGDTIQSITVTE